ncbi:NRDE family protein (plasmid) [Coraliomargarita sp. W4R53]
MCTVVVRVPPSPDDAVRVLAIRDEDPAREWNALGPWWPETHAGVVGVRDARAGGAWLAADPATSRFAVILNRADISARPESALTSRGAIVLDSVAGVTLTEPVPTHGFNLVTVNQSGANVYGWNGEHLTTTALTPGTHMVAHDGVDDSYTPRIARWLPHFRESEIDDAERWWMPWIKILERSAMLGSTDDRAIIRDNRPHGYATQSLLACVASITRAGVDIRYGELDEPGHWGGLRLA